MKFAFIAKHRHIWPVTWLCEVLEVSRSGLHAWLNRPASERANEDAKLVTAIDHESGPATGLVAPAAFGTTCWRTAENGITCSMRRAGNAWNSSAMDRFLSSPKTERTGRKVNRARDVDRADAFDQIERFHNPRRRHSKPVYLSPTAFGARAARA